MPDDVAALARFQSALVTLLAEGLSPEATRARLREDPAFGPFEEWIATLDDRSLGIAARVVRKHARR